MAVSTKEYYEGVLKQAGVSDAKRQALIAALDDDEVSKALANEQVVPRMRHDEYSREMDKLKDDKKKTTDYYQALLNWKAEQDALYAGQQNGNGNGHGQVINGEYLTKKELDAMRKEYNDELARRESVTISLLKDGMALASRHAVEFKEALDTDALEKIAVDRKLSLRQAYDEMVAPRRQTFSDERRKAELDAARAEGAREFASKHKIPVDTAPRDVIGRLEFNREVKDTAVPDYERNSGRLNPAQERHLRDNFVEAWDKAASGTSGT